ncbi:MAG: gamma-glutamyltransferase [Gammaproteobacteria bacterium]|nr:gamma-glutamyltransferase [Chromatiales bacterium]MYE49141.1 gamma-glutamyltransferase [Gammaproteobacteria bacterium]
MRTGFCLTRARLVSLAALALFAQDFALAEDKEGPYNIARDAYIVRYNDVFLPVVSSSAMVSTQSDFATRVGIDILNREGNAIDAAVAVGFALAVTLPRAGNIGGGGFMVVHDAATNESYTVDYRETAPSGVTAGDFLDEQGEKLDSSRFDWPAVGVPGTVAGLHKAWQQGGSLAWSDLLAPAIRLAEEGFTVNHDLAELLASKKEWLTQNQTTADSLYQAGGEPYAAGDVMRRPALARTLRLIAEKGPDVFYRGEVAEQIVSDMERFGGHIDRRDLEEYEAIIRRPIRGNYRGYEIVSMPPPSSGGIAIVEALNILENFPLQGWGYSAQSVHVLAEAMRLTFADRGNYMADPAFFDVPVSELTDKGYAAERASHIRLDRATPSAVINGGLAPFDEGSSTTHYSIVDANGTAVSNTYTLSSSFGAGLTISDTGILLNNQIHTFSVRAGIEGAEGFIASQANRVEEGKRPVSSQSPTIVMKDGKVFLVVGSPDGSRIITAVIQMIVNVIDFGMNIAEATNQRRIHHQWIPDILEVEPGFNLDTLALLESRGHTIEQSFNMGSTQSIQVGTHYLFGASDPRRPNALTLGTE